MSTDFFEGVSDRTEVGLRAILLAQAKVRIFLGVPVLIAEALSFAVRSGMPEWFIAFASAYCAYILSAYVLANRRSPISPRYLLSSTAVLDPLVLSAWLVLSNEYGILLFGFYLFTALGFGFRTGRPLMHLCQATSIAGFIAVLLLVPFWQQHIVIWASWLVTLVIVPMYASELIKLRKARDRAERESQAKSELLAKVSHELRTPLAGIIASTELLAVESSDSSVSKRTGTILTLSAELLGEIDNLLDEAKYEAGALKLAYAPVDLKAWVAKVRTTLEAVAAKKGLDFRINVDSAILDGVESDAHYLGRVLVNLAGNAIKFTDRGFVRLSIDLLESTIADYRLRFSVTDTGMGIPEAFHGSIFEPFSQIDHGPNSRNRGTGLGLALSKQLVELLGGELRFESAPGKGSRFWFELTLQRAAPSSVTASNAVGNIVSGKRILVVDDNATNLVLLKELLEIDSHEVATSLSGTAALEVLAEQDFDFLLLDYNLGDMDGVRLLQTYRFNRTCPAPALFLTADATSLTAARLMAAGGAGVLYKPVGLADLRKAVARATAFSGGDTPAFDRPLTIDIVEPAHFDLMVASANPIDQDAIGELKAVSSNPEFFPKLLAEAENDITRNCKNILEALTDGNHVLLRDAAHALKGVSANVGASHLTALASRLMLAPREELDSSREQWSTDVLNTSRITVSALRNLCFRS